MRRPISAMVVQTVTISDAHFLLGISSLHQTLSPLKSSSTHLKHPPRTSFQPPTGAILNFFALSRLDLRSTHQKARIKLSPLSDRLQRCLSFSQGILRRQCAAVGASKVHQRPGGAQNFFWRFCEDTLFRPGPQSPSLPPPSASCAQSPFLQRSRHSKPHYGAKIVRY